MKELWFEFMLSSSFTVLKVFLAIYYKTIGFEIDSALELSLRRLFSQLEDFVRACGMLSFTMSTVNTDGH
jgi:hypothetical protein